MDNHTDFESVYRQYAPELFRFCQFKLQNKENAQDTVAEAFVRYIKNEGKEIKEPRAWLYRVCRNLIYDDKVKINTHNQTDPIVEDSEEFHSDESTVEQLVIKSENIKLIREKINELDEQTSEIILLKVWEEMTFLEISEIVDMKEDAVKKRYYRGINVLHTLLK